MEAERQTSTKNGKSSYRNRKVKQESFAKQSNLRQSKHTEK